MKTYVKASTIAALAVWSAIAQAADAPVGNEHAMSQGYVPPQDPAVREKLEWWQDLKFGLMMHGGSYSELKLILSSS